MNKCLFSFIIVGTATACLLGPITNPVHAVTLLAGFTEFTVCMLSSVV